VNPATIQQQKSSFTNTKKLENKNEWDILRCYDTMQPTTLEIVATNPCTSHSDCATSVRHRSSGSNESCSQNGHR
jgi:hypothetical protein